MDRVMFFFDGFNIYHALEQNPSYGKYKWLDLSKLASCYVTERDEIAEMLYFTAYTPWSREKTQRHQRYVRALRTRGIRIVLGNFRRKQICCRVCGAWYPTYEEKQTDVNMAIQLFKAAINDRFDVAVIVSGDSDLIPSIEAVKSTFPTKKIGLVVPVGRRAKELKSAWDFHAKMKEQHLRTSQFPDVVALTDGGTLTRPSSWH